MKTETEQQVCAICNERTENLMRPGDAANLVMERDNLIKLLAQSEAQNERLSGYIHNLQNELAEIAEGKL